MASEWRCLSLREANVDLIDCDHRTPPAAEEGFPYVAIPQVRDGRIALSEARQIAPEHYVEWTRKAKPMGFDVVLSRRCNPGETAVVEPGMQFALGQNLVLLRADGTRLYPPFLRWLVRGPEWWEQINKFINVGAVFDSLKCADIPNFTLPIPPLAEQRAIAHILGTLDDKIELNRRMNETLEAMARALFKAWFVDFEPVRAKMEGRWKRGQSLPGLPGHLYDLFPNRLVDSELGKIQEGWRAAPLREIAEINPARRLPSGTLAPYLDMAHMPTHSARATCVVQREVGSGVRFLNGDTLVARITPCLENGKTCFVDFLRDGEVGWGSTEYIVLRARPPIPDCYAYFLARTDDFRTFAISNMTGTSGRQRVPVESLAYFTTPEPPAGLSQFFGQLASEYIRAMTRNDEDSHTLAALRDTLLPKLISGRIRVKDAQYLAGSLI
jgi:type I restriction enzyme S subunit